MAEEYLRRTIPMPPIAIPFPAGHRAIVFPIAGGESSMRVDYRRVRADLTASRRLFATFARAPERRPSPDLNKRTGSASAGTEKRRQYAMRCGNSMTTYLRDLGFHRVEIGSMAAECAGLAERTRRQAQLSPPVVW